MAGLRIQPSATVCAGGVVVRQTGRGIEKESAGEHDGPHDAL
jgi:hypothetical protein